MIGVYENSLSDTFTVNDGIEKGKTYSFRYRARNVNGAGQYSDVAYLTAA